jgi:hypothetical protein
MYWRNAIKLILIYNQNFTFLSGTSTTLSIQQVRKNLLWSIHKLASVFFSSKFTMFTCIASRTRLLKKAWKNSLSRDGKSEWVSEWEREREGGKIWDEWVEDYRTFSRYVAADSCSYIIIEETVICWISFQLFAEFEMQRRNCARKVFFLGRAVGNFFSVLLGTFPPCCWELFLRAVGNFFSVLFGTFFRAVGNFQLVTFFVKSKA